MESLPTYAHASERVNRYLVRFKLTQDKMQYICSTTASPRSRTGQLYVEYINPSGSLIIRFVYI